MPDHRNKAATAKLQPATCIESAAPRSFVARLRAEYRALDDEPLPVEHIDLLLALRHKERERKRRG